MTYTDEIVELRKKIVELSSNADETRELLDKLTMCEVDLHDVESPLLITKDDVVETKDKDYYSISKTKKGYLLTYKGGYSVFVKDNLMSPAMVLDEMMHKHENALTDEHGDETYALAMSAAEMIFRLPLFVFSHLETMFNIATMGAMYLNYLQQKGEVPTKETENPEYDKFLSQMAEMIDNLAEGLKKEGEEYERKMEINNGTKDNDTNES